MSADAAAVGSPALRQSRRTGRSDPVEPAAPSSTARLREATAPPDACPRSEVVERGGGGTGREAVLLDQSGGVHHPAVHDQVHLVEAEAPEPRLRATPASADMPGSRIGIATRPARRTAWDSARSPAPATL